MEGLHRSEFLLVVQLMYKALRNYSCHTWRAGPVIQGTHAFSWSPLPYSPPFNFQAATAVLPVDSCQLEKGGMNTAAFSSCNKTLPPLPLPAIHGQIYYLAPSISLLSACLLCGRVDHRIETKRSEDGHFFAYVPCNDGIFGPAC